MNTDKNPARADEQPHVDFSAEMSYGDYLHLDAVLSAQHPLSPDHNEMLFIVQHQTSELWMKLMLHELRAAVAALAVDRPAAGVQDAGPRQPDHGAVGPRVGRTRHDDAAGVFGDPPLPQGEQRIPKLAIPLHRVHHGQQECGDAQAPCAPTRSIGLGRAGLARAVAVRRGATPAGATRPGGAGRRTCSATGRSRTTPTTRSSRPGCRSTASRPAHWDLYQLGEELVDLEDAFRLWRFRHVTTVERVIGFKRGTGGTSGVSYLRKMLDVVLFPELWRLRTDL